MPMNECEWPKNRYVRALEVLKHDGGTAAANVFFGLFCLGAASLLWMLVQQLLFPDVGQEMTVPYRILFVAVLLLFLVCGFLILGPVFLGQLRWNHIISDRECSLSEIFYYCRSQNYRRAIVFLLQMLWRELFLFICALLPMLVLRQIEEYMVLTGSFTSSLLYSILLVLEAVAAVGGLLTAFFCSMRFFLAPALLFEREDLSAVACIHWSVSLTKGQQLDLMMLYCSLFPLYVLCVLGAPIFFVFPYLGILCAQRAKELMSGAIISERP